MTNKTLVLAGVGIATLISAVSAVSLVSADNSSVATTTQAKKTWSFKGLKQGNSSISDARGGTGQNGTGFFQGGQRGDRDGGKGGKHGGGVMGQGFGFGMGRAEHKNAAIEAAVTAKDYNAFVTAWNADTNKPANATVPTQDQFNEMVAHAAKRTAIEAAIKANDYNAFVEASKPTQAEFAKIVAGYKTHQAIEAAVTAKDYNAFVTAWNADTNKPANATVPTQDQFNSMVNKTQQK